MPKLTFHFILSIGLSNLLHQSITSHYTSIPSFINNIINYFGFPPDGAASLAGISKALFWVVILIMATGVSATVVVVLVLRRRRTKTPAKQQPSELQLNAGDSQYVVAFTLKPPRHAQPDILNPPPGQFYFQIIGAK